MKRRSWLQSLALVIALVPSLGAQAISGDEWTRSMHAWEWRRTVERMSAAERDAFAALPATARDAEARRLIDAARAREDRALLDSLAEDERNALQSLSRERMQVKLLEIRLRRKLDQAVADAERLGAIDAARAAAARGTVGTEAVAEEVLELQRAAFLVVHAESIARMPQRLRDDLSSLTPRQFFRHGAVFHLRTRAMISDTAFADLRFRGREAIESFVGAFASGRLDAEQTTWLRGEARDQYAAGHEDTRRDLAAQLRATFFRELMPRGRGPREGGMGMRMPPELFRQLTAEERSMFLSMPPQGQRMFVQRRFPEWAGSSGSNNPATVGRVQLTLREFLDGLGNLSDTERDDLLEMPIQHAVQSVISRHRGNPPQRR